MSEVPFVPGIELSARFYREVVRPLLDQHFPGLPHAAGRIGWGSDVLGYDTEMSTDHDWSPTVQLLLHDEDAAQAEPIREMLRCHLPHTFCGYPVDAEPVSHEDGTTIPEVVTEGPVDHRIAPMTLRAFVQRHLAYDLDQPIEPADWLSWSSQALLEVTAGGVHHDGLGQLTALRAQLAWYPHDVWLYLLACGWQRIGQEEHLMPRAGYMGDELGSSLIGSRLVRDAINLAFLMEKQYAPYPKWFGTAFRRLRCAADLWPMLWRAQRAPTWPEREAALVPAYESLARMHNALGITEPLPEGVSYFHKRPFRVIQGEAFAAAIAARIQDLQVTRIATRGLIGNLDQWSDNTDMRSHAGWRAAIRRLYE
jgi:hypothetical protein